MDLRKIKFMHGFETKERQSMVNWFLRKTAPFQDESVPKPYQLTRVSKTSGLWILRRTASFVDDVRKTKSINHGFEDFSSEPWIRRRAAPFFGQSAQNHTN